MEVRRADIDEIRSLFWRKYYFLDFFMIILNLLHVMGDCRPEYRAWHVRSCSLVEICRDREYRRLEKVLLI